MRITTVLGMLCAFFIVSCGNSPSTLPTKSQDSSSGKVAPVAAPESAAAVSTASLVIVPGQGVGELRFGMSQAEMEKILGKPERSMGAAHEYLSKGMAVMGSREYAVSALLFGDMNYPNGPIVAACKYKTDKGIAMGSTLDDLRKAYGEPSSVSPMSNGKMLSYKPLGATFSLRDGKVIHMVFTQLRR